MSRSTVAALFAARLVALTSALVQPSVVGSIAAIREKPTAAPTTFEVRVLPVPASWPQAQAVAQAANLAAGWSELGARISYAQARASSALEAADRTAVAATQGQLQASTAVAQAMQGASQVAAFRGRALEAARNTKGLLAEMKAAVARGVNKAVNEVLTDALQRLNKEEEEATKSITAAAPTPPESTAKMGVSASLEQAQAGASQIARGLVAEAHQLTATAANLKQQAAEVARQASQLQGRGSTLDADVLYMRSRELTGRLQPLSDEAEGLRLAASAAGLESQAYRTLAGTPAVVQSAAEQLPLPPAVLSLP